MIKNHRTDMVEAHINMLIKSDQHGMVIQSSPGMGKSYVVDNILRNNDVDYEIVTGVSRPAALYKKLYALRNKTIVFDDVSGLDNEDIRAFFKAALYSPSNGKRMISYNSSNLKGVPRTFEFKGKIILLLNRFSTINEDLRAVINRCEVINLDYNVVERVEMYNSMLNQAEIGGTEKVVVHDITELYVESDKEFSFRSLQRLIELFKYNNAELATKMFFFGEKSSVELDKVKGVGVSV